LTDASRPQTAGQNLQPLCAFFLCAINDLAYGLAHVEVRFIHFLPCGMIARRCHVEKPTIETSFNAKQSTD
jgi:hypothetical protein